MYESYEKISIIEFTKLYWGGGNEARSEITDFLEYTKGESERISNICTKGNLNNFLILLNDISGAEPRKSYVFLYKMPDEWFIVAYNIIENEKKLYTEEQYYRCDQMYGLVEFLETLK